MKIRLKKIKAEVSFEGVLYGMWQLAFAWLPLFYLSQAEARKYSRSNKSKKIKPFSIIIPLKQKTATALALLLIGVVGIASFGPSVAASYWPFEPKSLAVQTEDFSPSQNLEHPGMNRSEPVRLRIPNIGVDTGFIPLGLEADGTLQTPKGYDMAGWYTGAPTPGEIGPAVIVGHVDSYQGAAVFFRLKELIPGDHLEILRADGSTVTFQVETVKQFSQNNFPTAEVYGNINHAGVRLITCGGQFNQITQRYSDNTVVFATQVSP